VSLSDPAFHSLSVPIPCVCFCFVLIEGQCASGNDEAQPRNLFEMKRDFVSNTIAVAAPAASFHKMSELWALICALGVTVVVAAEAHWPPVSCERHAGAFGSGFSVGFDINRLECRANWIKRSPTLNVYGVSPYVSVSWPE
jgi:hypothetical protein